MGPRVKASLVCKDIGAASSLLRSLGNPSRLAIACLLLEGERSVMELEVALGIRQPTLSQQLTALRLAGLVASRRTKRTVIYRVCDERVEKVIKALRPMYPDLLPASAQLGAAHGGMDRANLVMETVLARIAEREIM